MAFVHSETAFFSIVFGQNLIFQFKKNIYIPFWLNQLKPE